MLTWGRGGGIPSLRMAMISTMKGGKSNFHIRASSMKPSCHRVKEEESHNQLNMGYKEFRRRTNSYNDVLSKMETSNLPQYG